jgi:16S rRNA A1518/A1519 N6-dimethyltransferase RsmA/KsgA/DIM1 with predicted DNA glycosylase/AP lyase activity
VVRTLRGLPPEAADAVLRRCDIDPMARPETLDAEAFARLVRALAEGVA